MKLVTSDTSGVRQLKTHLPPYALSDKHQKRTQMTVPRNGIGPAKIGVIVLFVVLAELHQARMGTGAFFKEIE